MLGLTIGRNLMPKQESAAELSTPCLLLVRTEKMIVYILFVYFDLKENSLQVTTYCWAVFVVVKREFIFVFLISLTTDAFSLSTVYTAAKFMA